MKSVIFGLLFSVGVLFSGTEGSEPSEPVGVQEKYTEPSIGIMSSNDELPGQH